MFIKFDEIPGHLNLFLDYLYEFDNVKEYYKYNFRDVDSYPDYFKQIASINRPEKEKIPDIIKSQYHNFNASDKTMKNIFLLGTKNAFAVVTGQQLGIMGGPLYTLYKIITAIKLADHLNEKYPTNKFVPVFWLEGDDHDFDEVKYIKLLDDQNKIVNIAYNDELDEEANRGDVGSIVFEKTINSFINEVSGSLRQTDFKEKVMEFYSGFYKEGKTFKASFKELLFSLFDKYGLVLFDPQDKRLKQLLKPVFKKEILNFRTHTQKLVETSAKLEEVYHAQVKIHPVNLFFHDSEGRYLIEPSENEFKLKRKRRKFTQEELIKAIEDTPEHFSPNVLLRPICQDYLLPTAFYVGGPSEISYFAQVMPLYKIFNIPEPIIYPRSSATIIEKASSSVIQKYSVDLKSLFQNSEELIEKTIARQSDYTIDGLFQPAIDSINSSFEELQKKLLIIDKQTSDATIKYKQKADNYLNELKAKANEANKRKHEITLKQLEKLALAVYPEKSLQERELNYAYFANKYGLEFLQLIFEKLEINKFDHQIISL